MRLTVVSLDAPFLVEGNSEKRNRQHVPRLRRWRTERTMRSREVEGGPWGWTCRLLKGREAQRAPGTPYPFWCQSSLSPSFFFSASSLIFLLITFSIKRSRTHFHYFVGCSICMRHTVLGSSREA